MDIGCLVKQMYVLPGQVWKFEVQQWRSYHQVWRGRSQPCQRRSRAAYPASSGWSRGFWKCFNHEVVQLPIYLKKKQRIQLIWVVHLKWFRRIRNCVTKVKARLIESWGSVFFLLVLNLECILWELYWPHT